MLHRWSAVTLVEPTGLPRWSWAEEVKMDYQSSHPDGESRTLKAMGRARENRMPRPAPPRMHEGVFDRHSE